MKKIILLIVMCVTLLSVSSNAGVSVFGGVMLPQEQFEGVSDPGIVVGANLSVPIIPTLLSAGVQGSVSRSDFDFSAFPAGLYDDYSATWYVGEAIGFAKLSFPLSGLNVKAGLGYTRYGISESDDYTDFVYESETYLVGVVGAGMKILVLDLSAQYHVVNWDDQPVDSFDELVNYDKSFSYFTLTAGFEF